MEHTRSYRWRAPTGQPKRIRFYQLLARWKLVVGQSLIIAMVEHAGHCSSRVVPDLDWELATLPLALLSLNFDGQRHELTPAQIYKCQNPACPPPSCYRSYPSSKELNPKCERPGCDSRMELIRHVSFVDW